MEERDREIDELKELVRRNIAIAENTNHLVRRMRRAQQWGRFFQIVWWILIIAVSGATYYLYFKPYVGKVEQLYGQVRSGTDQVQSWNTQMQNFFANLSTKKATQ
jgi:hypothetical protein